MLTYSRGEWGAAVTPTAAALFAQDMPADSLAQLWRALGEAPTPGAVIGSLISVFGSSLEELPAFVVAFHDAEAGSVRLMVRGVAQARVTVTGGAVRQITGLGVSTWTECVVESVVAVELVGAGDGDEAIPMRDGVVFAERLRWPLVSEGGTGQEARVVAAAASAQPVPEPEPEPEARPDPVPAPAPEVRPEPAPAPGTEADPRPTTISLRKPGADAASSLSSATDETAIPPMDSTHAQPEAEPAIEPMDASASDQSGASTAASSTGAEPAGDLLMGYTEFLFGTPKRDDVAGGDVLLVNEPLLAENRPVEGNRAAQPDDQPVSRSAGDLQQLGDHDGETVAGDQAAALSAEALAAIARGEAVGGTDESSAASNPFVVGDRSGAQREREREPSPALWGAAPMDAGDVLRAAGAASPVLVVSTGERVVLDRSAVVGRRPHSVRASGELPRLVTVPSPAGDISRVHVELQVEGRDVVAVDNDSTNGTWLLRVGVDPVRLQPKERALLVRGDRLDLGEGVVLSFEGIA